MVFCCVEEGFGTVDHVIEVEVTFGEVVIVAGPGIGMVVEPGIGGADGCS